MLAPSRAPSEARALQRTRGTPRSHNDRNRSEFGRGGCVCQQWPKLIRSGQLSSKLGRKCAKCGRVRSKLPLNRQVTAVGFAQQVARAWPISTAVGPAEELSPDSTQIWRLRPKLAKIGCTHFRDDSQPRLRTRLRRRRPCCPQLSPRGPGPSRDGPPRQRKTPEDERGHNHSSCGRARALAKRWTHECQAVRASCVRLWAGHVLRG